MLRSWGLAGAAVVFAISAANIAHAADISPMPTKAYSLQNLPAVDGVNGKIDGFGGEASHHTFYGSSGSLSVPLGQQFGVQVDGLAGSFRGDFLGGAGIHAFWRNPAQGLFGFYADYSHWDRFGGVNAHHFGAEGAAYIGRATIEGIVGVESGSTATGIIGAFTETIDIKTRFFDKVDLAYYFTDNMKAYIGHRYLGGKNLLALGGEWAVPTPVSTTMATVFAEGRVGNSDSSSVWAGLRFYFGQRAKSLIRRHREDDPVNGLGDATSTFGNSTSSTPTPTLGCAPPLVFFQGACRGVSL
jgi:hypothetical protein